MPRLFYPPWFDHPNKIRWRVRIMRLLKNYVIPSAKLVFVFSILSKHYMFRPFRTIFRWYNFRPFWTVRFVGFSLYVNTETYVKWMKTLFRVFLYYYQGSLLYTDIIDSLCNLIVGYWMVCGTGTLKYWNVELHNYWWMCVDDGNGWFNL